jgi:ABC-type transport system involved in multi-copper enzyme maturation permease subunit
VSDLASLLGPLAGPECRRLTRRGWLFLVRTLLGAACTGVVLVACWLWWLLERLDASFRPGASFGIALGICAAMPVTLALLLCPAVLAGVLAGEKDRGTLALLLAARVTALEIVLARLASRLAQVVMILLAGLPAVVLLAMLSGLGGAAIGVLVLLPFAVALGGSGMALAASALSRRGRDALLAVYLLDLLFLIAPLFSAVSGFLPLAERLGALNPYRGLSRIIQGDAWGGAESIALWTLLGVAGTGLAAWRLRPAYLRQIGGTARRRDARRGRVPAVGDRPVLWKELYIERAAAMGRFGRLLGWLIVLLLLGAAGSLAFLIAWHRWVYPNPTEELWAAGLLETLVQSATTPVSWLLQWAIGLRAAVGIASERERATWDGLLLTPLEGTEIMWAKIWGSLYALRGLFLAALIAWALAVLLGALELTSFLSWLLHVLVIGFFMAAVGSWISLTAPSATRAMAITIGIWLGAIVVMATIATIVVLFGALIVMLVWLSAVRLGLAAMAGGPPVPVSFGTAWNATYLVLYLASGLLIAFMCRFRFDRFAGRTPSRAATGGPPPTQGRDEGPAQK